MQNEKIMFNFLLVEAKIKSFKHASNKCELVHAALQLKFSNS